MKQIRIALRTLLSLLLLASVQFAFAGEFSTVVNGKSFHIGSKHDWNEKNFGLGFEYALDTDSKWKPILMANAFRDSHDNMSYMAGGGLHRTVFSSDELGGLYVDLGVNAFLMTRKGVNDGKPFPGALPSMTVGNRYVGVNLTYLPRMAIKEITPDEYMDKDIKGVVFVQFKFNANSFMPFNR